MQKGSQMSIWAPLCGCMRCRIVILARTTLRPGTVMKASSLKKSGSAVVVVVEMVLLLLLLGGISFQASSRIWLEVG